MTGDEMKAAIVRLAEANHQDYCIIENRSGWAIRPIGYRGPGKRLYETIYTVEGVMYCQVGENFIDYKSAR